MAKKKVEVVKTEVVETKPSTLQQKWYEFESWVHSWFPGVKTKAVLMLGLIGDAAASMQEYVTGLPLSQYLTPENLIIANVGLFTLAYWFRGLGDRVVAREEV